MKQRVGVVLAAPTLAEQHQDGSQQIRQGIGHEFRPAQVLEAVHHPGDDAGAFQKLPLQHGAAVTVQVLGPAFDSKAAVERRREAR